MMGPTRIEGVPPQRARDQYERIAILSDSTFLASRSDDSIMTVLRGARGGAGDGVVRGTMTEPEMRAVIADVRSLVRRRSGR